MEQARGPRLFVVRCGNLIGIADHVHEARFRGISILRNINTQWLLVAREEIA